MARSRTCGFCGAATRLPLYRMPQAGWSATCRYVGRRKEMELVACPRHREEFERALHDHRGGSPAGWWAPLVDALRALTTELPHPVQSMEGEEHE